MVADEARARGMSISSLVRVSLAQVTGLPVTRPNEVLLPRQEESQEQLESQEKLQSQEKLIA
jgi:hypothetical protein